MTNFMKVLALISAIGLISSTFSKPISDDQNKSDREIEEMILENFIEGRCSKISQMIQTKEAENTEKLKTLLDERSRELEAYFDGILAKQNATFKSSSNFVSVKMINAKRVGHGYTTLAIICPTDALNWEFEPTVSPLNHENMGLTTHMSPTSGSTKVSSLQLSTQPSPSGTLNRPLATTTTLQIPNFTVQQSDPTLPDGVEIESEKKEVEKQLYFEKVISISILITFIALILVCLYCRCFY